MNAYDYQKPKPPEFAPFAMNVYGATLEDAVRVLIRESFATSPPAVSGYLIRVRMTVSPALELKWCAHGEWTAVSTGEPPDASILSQAEVPAKKLLGYRVRRQTQDGLEYLTVSNCDDAWVPAGLRSARALFWAPNEEGRGYARVRAKKNGGRVVRVMQGHPRASDGTATAELRAVENRLTSANARIAQLEEQISTRGRAELVLKEARIRLGLGPDDAILMPLKEAVDRSLGTLGILGRFRAAGWVVAVHNDYRQDGEARTFWLFSKDGRCVKGEGKTDYDALVDVDRNIGLAGLR
jgi:hypothetical protein